MPESVLDDVRGNVCGPHSGFKASTSHGVDDAGSVTKKKDILMVEEALPMPAREVVAVDPNPLWFVGEALPIQEGKELFSPPWFAAIERQQTNGEVIRFGKNPTDPIGQSTKIGTDYPTPLFKQIAADMEFRLEGKPKLFSL